MGWVFGWSTYSELADYIRKDVVSASPGARILAEAKTAAGRHYWLAVEWTRKDGTRRREVELFLIAGHNFVAGLGGDWGYKSMSEHAGPFVYDCPLKVLDATGEDAEADASGYAHEWRVKVREYHAKQQRGRKLAHSLKVGQSFWYDDGSETGKRLTFTGRRHRLFLATDGWRGYRFNPAKVKYIEDGTEPPVVEVAR